MSEEDFVLLGLNKIVDTSGPLVMSVRDAEVHIACCIEIVKILAEAKLQVLEADRFEAREARVPHKLDHVLNLIGVLTYSKESLHDFLSEEFVGLSLGITTKYVYEL